MSQIFATAFYETLDYVETYMQKGAELASDYHSDVDHIDVIAPSPRPDVGKIDV